MAPSRRMLDKQRKTNMDLTRLVQAGQPRAEGIVNACVPQADAQGYVAEIRRLWLEARDKILAIGQYLALAKETLPHGTYEAMIESQLPFRAMTARKIRAIYDAVRAHILEPDQVPGHYTTAYALVVLRPEEIQMARARRLVRPDVTMREITALRDELRGGDERRTVLETERKRALRDMERIRTRLIEIEAELETIEAEPEALAAE